MASSSERIAVRRVDCVDDLKMGRSTDAQEGIGASLNTRRPSRVEDDGS